jgi:hypothetical protein
MVGCCFHGLLIYFVVFLALRWMLFEKVLGGQAYPSGGLMWIVSDRCLESLGGEGSTLLGLEVFLSGSHCP